jgi:hypothetical protein
MAHWPAKEQSLGCIAHHIAILRGQSAAIDSNTREPTFAVIVLLYRLGEVLGQAGCLGLVR